jgi:hypothetical protein
MFAYEMNEYVYLAWCGVCFGFANRGPRRSCGPGLYS